MIKPQIKKINGKWYIWKEAFGFAGASESDGSIVMMAVSSFEEAISIKPLVWNNTDIHTFTTRTPSPDDDGWHGRTNNWPMPIT